MSSSGAKTRPYRHSALGAQKRSIKAMETPWRLHALGALGGPGHESVLV